AWEGLEQFRLGAATVLSQIQYRGLRPTGRGVSGAVRAGRPRVNSFEVAALPSTLFSLRPGPQRPPLSVREPRHFGAQSVHCLEQLVEPGIRRRGALAELQK